MKSKSEQIYEAVIEIYGYECSKTHLTEIIDRILKELPCVDICECGKPKHPEQTSCGDCINENSLPVE